jgi:hypothetical protein
MLRNNWPKPLRKSKRLKLRPKTMMIKTMSMRKRKLKPRKLLKMPRSSRTK